jgi:hypothetical protein
MRSDGILKSPRLPLQHLAAWCQSVVIQRSDYGRLSEALGTEASRAPARDYPCARGARLANSSNLAHPADITKEAHDADQIYTDIPGRVAIRVFVSLFSDCLI